MFLSKNDDQTILEISQGDYRAAIAPKGLFLTFPASKLDIANEVLDFVLIFLGMSPFQFFRQDRFFW